MDDAPDGDSVRVADYVLWKCNRKEWFFYVDELKLDGPTDDIMEVLGKITNGDLGDKYKLVCVCVCVRARARVFRVPAQF